MQFDVEGVFGAQLCAIEHAAQVGFGGHVVGATSPFSRDEPQALRDEGAADAIDFYSRAFGTVEQFCLRALVQGARPVRASAAALPRDRESRGRREMQRRCNALMADGGW